ncbi:hypothetical protein [uncultured Parasutterella sp.]|uniref:hypothetical protein n=1 Tax=uncultured Parasutterella sp. TaxID=1263098 RepID=UPI00259A15CE|nr:hypothetical protein [uncultured Parasutterella sp.]
MQKETWSDRLRREIREGERELSGIELEMAEEAWAKGRAEGWAQVQAEMAAKLIRLGQMSLEAIAEVSGLSIEQLREIKKNLSCS